MMDEGIRMLVRDETIIEESWSQLNGWRGNLQYPSWWVERGNRSGVRRDGGAVSSSCPIWYPMVPDIKKRRE